MKIISQNKKAFFDYEILDKIEAGVVLNGNEVKSIRAGHISLIGAFAHVKDNEIYLVNVQITPYSKAYQKKDEEATRTRKLLVHRRELNRMVGDISRKGVTVIPLKVYINDRGLIKVELGICKHKKMFEKKQALKERDIKRETSRELKKY